MKDTKKYTNHSIDEIEKYLKNVKEQVKKITLLFQQQIIDKKIKIL